MHRPNCASAWSTCLISFCNFMYLNNLILSDQPDSSSARPGSPGQNTSYPSNGYPPNRLDSTDVGVRRPRPHDVWVDSSMFVKVNQNSLVYRELWTHGRTLMPGRALSTIPCRVCQTQFCNEMGARKAMESPWTTRITHEIFIWLFNVFLPYYTVG